MDLLTLAIHYSDPHRNGCSFGYALVDVPANGAEGTKREVKRVIAVKLN